MTRKQRHQREERLLLPPSPPPRNPFATTTKMRRGVEVHEKSQGAKRRERHMQLQRILRGDFSAADQDA
ncbi:hypothetical protein AGMMS49545_23930 [Betaproteobacteria bacterium]|nr:hypothetical protein AGMMS49545_23930 [Betaproteobacteria bacterium]GHU42095.1 hypothetical protein AGMMS50289_06250 [Betaproteobacteria bacterium]